MNEHIVLDAGVDSEAGKVLIDAIPFQVIGITIPCSRRSPSRVKASYRRNSSLPQSPQSAHDSSIVIVVVADNVAYISRLHETVDCPPILPMDAAVCVTEETDIHVGFVNRKETMNHVLGSRDARVSDANRPIGEQTVPECRLGVGSQIEIYDPPGVMGLDQ
jgi:hypothetical protein